MPNAPKRVYVNKFSTTWFAGRLIQINNFKHFDNDKSVLT